MEQQQNGFAELRAQVFDIRSIETGTSEMDRSASMTQPKRAHGCLRWFIEIDLLPRW